MAVTATEQWIKEKLDIKTDILSEESHLNNMLYQLFGDKFNYYILIPILTQTQSNPYLLIIITHPHSYSYTDSIQSLSPYYNYTSSFLFLHRLNPIPLSLL